MNKAGDGWINLIIENHRKDSWRSACTRLANEVKIMFFLSSYVKSQF